MRPYRLNTTFRVVMAGIILAVLVFWMICFNSGCARLQVGEMTYTRFGNNTVDVYVVLPDGSCLMIRQDSKTELAKDLLETAKELMR